MTTKRELTYIAIGILIVIAIIVGIILFSGSASSFPVLDSYEGEIKIYKSLSCGCCGLYSNYFEGKGNSNVDVVNLDDLSSLKSSYGVPSSLGSCHTTIIGDYFIEGHVPLEAVEKLLTENPDIAGIALPRMPSGTPGMPGPKTEDWVIYAINHDGTYGEFMRI